MAQLTREDVLKLARLARLELTEAEVETFQQELSNVLDYVAQLQSVDVDGLEPTSQVSGNVNIMRDDAVRNYGVGREDLLRQAPNTQDGLLKVKRMIA